MYKAVSLNKKGYTIVETGIAVIILGLGLFAIGSIFMNSFAYINEAKEIAIATAAAQEAMENIRNTSFGTAPSFAASGLSYLYNAAGTAVVDSIYGDPGNIKRVTVTVNWTSRLGRPMSKSLSTLITRNGIDKQ